MHNVAQQIPVLHRDTQMNGCRQRQWPGAVLRPEQPLTVRKAPQELDMHSPCTGAVPAHTRNHTAGSKECGFRTAAAVSLCVGCSAASHSTEAGVEIRLEGCQLLWRQERRLEGVVVQLQDLSGAQVQGMAQVGVVCAHVSAGRPAENCQNFGCSCIYRRLLFNSLGPIIAGGRRRTRQSRRGRRS